MVEAVLDSSAVLALVQREDGADAVGRVVDAGGGAISTVNLSEVAGRLMSRGLPHLAAARVVESLHLDVHTFDYEQAFASAALLLRTRVAGLSLGDRACLALAQALGVPVLTTDRAWSRVDVGVTITVVR